ncbi:MAG: ABC transporter ATP-binding protein [Candidatus Dormibacteria bacterium]
MISELYADNVGVNVGSRAILDGVELRVHQGEVVVVTGPSGSGKTTLMLVMAGLQVPTRGRVLLDGRPVPSGEVGRRLYGVVLQNHGLVAVLTAAENVALPLQARRLPREEVAERTRRTLGAVGLDENSDHLVQDLSGGQQQRVAVARALAGDPDIVLADEPTSELSADFRGVVLKMLVAHARKGRIVVIASHDPEVVDASDRSLRLVDGRPGDPTPVAVDAGPARRVDPS